MGRPADSGIAVTGLRDSLEAGLTLPASWYSEPAVLELERERIFARTWQYVGHAGQVAEPGSFAASSCAHVPVVLVRDQDDSLRGFVNVCRHRGHVVAEGCGRRETLQCPYHAWTYGLDGTLRRAPRSEREPGFDPGAYSLLPVAVDTWGPLVFCNPDPDAAPLADTLGELPDLVRTSGLDFGSLRFHGRREWELEANWKIAVENYLECYHCPVAHPSFSRLIDVDPDSYVLEARGLALCQFGPVRESALTGNGAPYPLDGTSRQGQYHYLWPNFAINVYPGTRGFSVDLWRPDGPARTVGWADYFFGDDVAEETIGEVIAFSAQVGGEDTALVESVHRGLASGQVPSGRLLLSSEHLIQEFQRLVLDALAG